MKYEIQCDNTTSILGTIPSGRRLEHYVLVLNKQLLINEIGSVSK